MKCSTTLAFAAIALALAGSADATSLKSVAAPTASAPAVQRVSSPADFDVYVDRETRFAFVKTPIGWKFTRQIEPEKLALVPRQYFVPVASRHSSLLALSAKR